MITLARLSPAEAAALQDLAQQSGLYRADQLALIAEKCSDTARPQPEYGYSVIVEFAEQALAGFIFFRKRSLTAGAFEIAELAAAPPQRLRALIEAACAAAAQQSGTLVLAEYPDSPNWDPIAAQLQQAGFVQAGATPHLYGPHQGSRHYVRHLNRPAQASIPDQPVRASLTETPSAFGVTIAPTAADERAAILAMTSATAVFGEDDLAVVQELLQLYLQHGEAYGYHFISARQSVETIGYACFGPRPATAGVYDLYWICADPQRRQQGVGRSLMAAVEAAVLARGGYAVILETSGASHFAPTRRFYEAIGYSRRVWVEDFYAPQDGLLVYARYLRPIAD